MKKILSVLMLVLCSFVLLSAKDKDKGKDAGVNEMTGYVCNSKCVKQDAGKATCDATCKDKSGDMVFVDDGGKVIKIANPKKVKANMMGKEVKVKCKMKGDEMSIMEMVLANAG